MVNFERVHEKLNEIPEDREQATSNMEQQEMYILHCLYHQLPTTDIDFSRFTVSAIDSAEAVFEDSVQFEDEDGNIRFMRDSAWGTIDATAHVMSNFESVKGIRFKPAFPLI